MFHLHKWGEWHEFSLNKHRFQLPKKEQRECLVCHKDEQRPFPTLERRILELAEKDGIDLIRRSLEHLEEIYGVAQFGAQLKHLLGMKYVDNENVLEYTEDTMKPWQKTNAKRNKEMLKLHKRGMSLRAIGKLYKVSGQRVGMILSKMKVVDKI